MSLPIYAGGSTGYGEGGLGGHLRFLCEAARRAERDVHVLCRGRPGGGPQDALAPCEAIPAPGWADWVKVTPFRWSTALQTRWLGEQFDRQAARRLPAERPVIYHSFPGFAEESFRKVKQSGGIAVLEAATTHAGHVYAVTEAEHRRYGIGGSPFSAEWVRRAEREYRLADYITVASELQRRTFLERGFPSDKLLYAPLGVDTGRFSPPADSSRSWHPQAPFRIVQVGQISLRKGFVYLLEAVRKLQDPRIEIVLVGGVGRRGIRRMLERYRQMGLNIRQAGGDPLPYLRSAHLYVHSSVEDGFGLAPLEAMATGLPVIVTDQTGMQDLVTDGRDGVIVPSRDAHRIADSIAWLMSDENARLSMGLAAAKQAAQYDAKACMRAYAAALLPAWGRTDAEASGEGGLRLVSART